MFLEICPFLLGCPVHFSSVAQSCLTLCDPMDCSMPGFPVHTNSQNLLKLMSIESVMSCSHIILCHPLLLLSSIFPSIRVFSNESVFCIRWPKYWNFSFSICPSNEYSEYSLKSPSAVILESKSTRLSSCLACNCVYFYLGFF